MARIILLGVKRLTGHAAIGAPFSAGRWFHQDDLIGTELEQTSEVSQLRDQRHASATLPKVNRLWLHTNLERQLELGPTPILP